MLATPLLARPQDGGGEGRGAYSRFPYSLYAPFLTIISWLGILFLLTPHRDIFIFLPHLDAAADTAISVSMGVLYFDAAVGAVVFFTGFRRRRMALLMAAVTVLFSLSLLSPSMRWVLSARPLDAVIIYITVLAMLLLITALSYQLKRRRNAFLMSYGSSVLAYVLSMAVIVYNIVSVLH
ncbi:hypothetical protein [Thermogymnomonas acidicola]|uniref:hypothetical protein n=1 Tax=Thermogymnomonas acidicola TaxID=399579 RepID=UPI0009464765|nr:hypothetical protein [Thermogymnomonas acidicola]